MQTSHWHDDPKNQREHERARRQGTEGLAPQAQPEPENLRNRYAQATRNDPSTVVQKNYVLESDGTISIVESPSTFHKWTIARPFTVMVNGNPIVSQEVPERFDTVRVLELVGNGLLIEGQYHGQDHVRVTFAVDSDGDGGDPGTQRPLQIRKRGEDVGDSQTEVLDFDNLTLNKPAGYLSRVWFDVDDIAQGERRIRGWYQLSEEGGTPYSWTILDGLSNGDVVADGDVVRFMPQNPTEMSVDYYYLGGQHRIYIGMLGAPSVYQNGTLVGTARQAYNLDFAGDAVVPGMQRVSWLVQETFPDLTGWWRRVEAFVPAQRDLRIRQDGLDVGDAMTSVIDFVNPPVLANAVQVTFDVVDVAPGERRIRAYVPAYPVGGESRPLQIQQTGLNKGDDQTDLLNFENAVEPKPTEYTKRVWFEVDDLGGGDRRIRGWYEDEVGEGPVFSGLQIRQTGLNVGPKDTEYLDFDNTAEPKPVAYTKRVWFDVEDVGPNERRLRGWYEDNLGSYGWNVGVNGETPGQSVANGNLVRFSGTGNIVVTRSGLDVNIHYQQPVWDFRTSLNEVQVGASDRNHLQWYNTLEERPSNYTHPVWFELEDIEPGKTRVKGWFRDLLGEPGEGTTWYIGVNAETPGEAVQEGDLVRIVQGTNISVSRTGRDIAINNTYAYNWTVKVNSDAGQVIGSGNQVNFIAGTGVTLSRTGSDITINGLGPYKWRLSADGITSSQIDDNDLVTFVGGEGIVVSRIGKTIRISREVLGFGNRRLTGFITFDNAGAIPSGKMSILKTFDIVHNWNLSDRDAYTLELKDVIYNESGTPGVVAYHRGDALTDAGENLGDVTFRNKPYWVAIDNNTIRVYARMYLLKPTVMKFHYVLQEA